MFEAGRHLWRSLRPTPLIKQGHLEQFAQDHVPIAFEYVQRWRLYSLPWQLGPVLSHHHSEKGIS